MTACRATCDDASHRSSATGGTGDVTHGPVFPTGCHGGDKGGVLPALSLVFGREGDGFPDSGGAP